MIDEEVSMGLEMVGEEKCDREGRMRFGVEWNGTLRWILSLSSMIINWRREMQCRGIVWSFKLELGGFLVVWPPTVLV